MDSRAGVSVGTVDTLQLIRILPVSLQQETRTQR